MASPSNSPLLSVRRKDPGDPSPTHSPTVSKRKNGVDAETIDMGVFSASDHIDEPVHIPITARKKTASDTGSAGFSVAAACKLLAACLAFGLSIQAAYHVGMASHETSLCGDEAYSKLFVQLSSLREEITKAEEENLQLRAETDKWKGELDNLVQNSTTVDEQVKHLTEALSEKATAAQALSDQVKELEDLLRKSSTNERQLAAHIKYLEKMLKNQSAEEKLAAQLNAGETLEPEETGDEAETIDDIKMKLAVERHLKEDALSHVLELQRELAKERLLASEAQTKLGVNGTASHAVAAPASGCTELTTRVAGAFTLLSEKVATLFEERVEDGLSDNLAGQDMDTVMGLISRGMQAMPGTHEYSEASQLSHWLTVAKQGADGMLPVDYYRVQGASTLSLLASKDFPFDADHSVLEYSIGPLGAIEYLANEKSYSVSPLGNFFDIIYKAARRPDVKRAVSARHLADKLGPNSVDDLIAFTSGEDWADSNIDELRSLLAVLRPNGWFLMHISGHKQDVTELEAKIRGLLDSFVTEYEWDCAPPPRMSGCSAAGRKLDG